MDMFRQQADCIGLERELFLNSYPGRVKYFSGNRSGEDWPAVVCNNGEEKSASL
jgi:hypothetical protein